MDPSMAELVTKVGLQVVVVLWVLATFTRELRDIRTALQEQAKTLAALAKAVDHLDGAERGKE
jgi:hypothetical protein